MKCLILILMVAMLSACGQQQGSESSRSFVAESEKIEGPIIMSQGVTVDVKGVCSFNTDVGKIELELCGENFAQGFVMIPNWQLNGYSFAAEVIGNRIVIDIVYRDQTGIYPGNPEAMNGRLEIRGVYE